MAHQAAPSLPEQWSLASFPFARQPGVNRKQIHTFAELEFIAKAENIVLVGRTGVGKTGLASGLLLKALGEWLPLPVHPRPGPVRRDVCLAGRPFLAPTAEPPGSSGRLLIDELGYLNLKPEQSNIFFKLMEERYHRHSTIITTQSRTMTNGATSSAIKPWWTRC